MKKLTGLLLIVSIASSLTAAGAESNASTAPGPAPAAQLRSAEGRQADEGRQAGEGRQADEGRQAELQEARRHLEALSAVFPDRVEEVAFRRNDWAVRIDGVWFAWAEGRLLPEAESSRWEAYSPVRFYSYYPGPARFRELSPEREAALRGELSAIDARRPPRSPAFADALYDIRSRAEAELRMREVSFLGRRTRVHFIAYDALKRVEARILRIAETDRGVRSFVDTLSTVHGYNWRNIAGSGSRSYHSYGLAVDLLPASFEGLPAYWRWAAEAGITEWWRIPIDRRWSPPQEVVDAFESEGFYWGGKWLFFDNFHFEYRPEVFEF